MNPEVLGKVNFGDFWCKSLSTTRNISILFYHDTKGKEQFPLFFLRGLAKQKLSFLKTCLSLTIILENKYYQQIYPNSLMYLRPLNLAFITNSFWKFKLSTLQTKEIIKKKSPERTTVLQERSLSASPLPCYFLCPQH